MLRAWFAGSLLALASCDAPSCEALGTCADPCTGGERWGYLDGDADGWGAGNAVYTCDLGGAYVERSGDCDDGDAGVFPGAEDVAGDSVDTNCDGIPGVDADGDGVASVDSGGADCMDTHPDIGPGVMETLVDGIDQDCDPSTGATPRFDGDPIGLNTTTVGSQTHATAAFASDGRGLVVWESIDDGVDLWSLSWDENRLFSEERWLRSDGKRPEVEATGTGDWWVVSVRGDDGAIEVDRVSAEGSVVGESLLIAAEAGRFHGFPDLGVGAEDDVTVVWLRGAPSVDDPGVERGTYGHARFDAGGVVVGPVEVFDALDGAEMVGGAPAVAGNGAQVVLAWEEIPLGFDGGGLVMWVDPEATGQPTSAVEVAWEERQLGRPALAIDEEGGIAVVWATQAEDGDEGRGAWLRLFDGEGVPRTGFGNCGEVWQLCAIPIGETGRENRPEIAVGAGVLVVVWEASTDEDGGDVWLAVHDARDGARLSTPLRVNTVTEDYQGHPDIDVAVVGDRLWALVTWESVAEDGDLRGVYGRWVEVGAIP